MLTIEERAAVQWAEYILSRRPHFVRLLWKKELCEEHGETLRKLIEKSDLLHDRCNEHAKKWNKKNKKRHCEINKRSYLKRKEEKKYE